MTTPRPAVPDPHATFLDRAIEVLEHDERLVGVAAGGSYATGKMDEYSDLDLVIAVEPDADAAVLDERRAIAATLGRLLAAFTGEHVNEPRILICLYGSPMLHVDLKFVSLLDAADRTDAIEVVWERDGRLSAILASGPAEEAPRPDLQWIEDRFWVWIHYGAVKIGRGELFEAIDFVSFLRARVLGPLALTSQGARPYGVRRLEEHAGELARSIEATVPTYDARSCADALQAAVDLYLELRCSVGEDSVQWNEEAKRVAIGYLADIRARCAP